MDNIYFLKLYDNNIFVGYRCVLCGSIYLPLSTNNELLNHKEKTCRKKMKNKNFKNVKNVKKRKNSTDSELSDVFLINKYETGLIDNSKLLEN